MATLDGRAGAQALQDVAEYGDHSAARPAGNVSGTRSPAEDHRTLSCLEYFTMNERVMGPVRLVSP